MAADTWQISDPRRPKIAAELGVTADTARRRYSRHAQTRSQPLEAD